MPEPHIILETFEGKIVGFKNLRFELRNKEGDAVLVCMADFSCQDMRVADQILKEITDITKEYFDNNFKSMVGVFP